MPTVEEASRRIPPQNLEAEESVLGSILLDNNAIDRVVELVQPDDFYRGAHRKLYRAMLDLSERNEPIDLITLAEALKGRGDLADVGGATFLAELAARVPTAANVVHYARIVRDRAVLRGLIAASTEIVSRGYEGVDDVPALLDRAEQLIFDISERQTRNAFTRLADVLVGSLKTIEALYEQKQSVTGVPTGFADLDRMTSGFQPSDLIIVAGRPSMGKCLTADAEIVLSDGSIRTIEQIVQARSGALLTLNDRWRFETTEPSAFVDDGRKPVFEVTTRLGRKVRTTLSHPFLTIDGWKPLGEIRAGDHIAVPRRLDVFGTTSLGESRVKALAYLLGDGTLTGPCARFTNVNPRLQAEFRDAVEGFEDLTVRDGGTATRARTVAVSSDRTVLAARRRRFGDAVRRALADTGRSARDVAGELGVSPASLTHWCQGKTAPRASVFAGLCGALALVPEEVAPDGPASLRRSDGNALMRWLDELGVRGKTARHKFIPDVVFTLVAGELSCFLNRLFATDGWATVLASGQPQIGFCSASERMARQVQHLLLRFGIIAQLRARRIRYKAEFRLAYQLDVTDADSIAAFVERIGIFGKESAIGRVRDALRARRVKPSRDVIPSAVWRRIDEARRGRPWSALGALMGLGDTSNLHVGTRGLSRRRLRGFADALDDQGLRDLATSDVYWDAVMAIEPIGVEQVYDLTVPRSHNFVANDVCVHNTAFCLNVAENAALRSDVGVAVFSLEMSKEQLAMRMLCSEARVDLARVRTGHLSDREFPRLAMAAGRLAGAPIYIDDTPALTVMELRAKARRLKRDAASKLGLVVVDYIQLMRSSEGKDNREQEISEISRSLKALAKELHLPVVALSQLNRQVENRSPPIPRLADLRECVTGDTLVMLADGRRLPIAELVGSTPRVLALSPEGRVVEAASDAIWSVGRRPVFRVRLASGRELTATEQHRVLTGHGWRRVCELAVGDRLAAARMWPEPTEPVTWPDEQVVLLGQLIGDGSYLAGQPLRYTTSSDENSAAVANAAREGFGAVVRRYEGQRTWHQLLLSGNGNRWRPDGVNAWLRRLGVFGQRSHEKRVPRDAFRLSSRQIGLLLRHLWATDGCIWTPPAGVRHAPRVYYATTSRGLAGDVAALLLRLGITARTHLVRQGTNRVGYAVSVSGAEDQGRFLDRVGAFGPRVAPARRLSVLLATTRANTNVDTLPRERFEIVKAAMHERGISQRTMAALRGTSYGGTSHFRFAPSRATLAGYAELLDSPSLRAEAESDVFWDRVVAVEPAGDAEVFDLTVPGPASWLADGLVSHNSGAIEQDADVIIFLYREEYYQDDSDKKGLADIIVSKQRNGPTGDLQLTFLREFTRFENREVAPEEESGGSTGSALH